MSESEQPIVNVRLKVWLCTYSTVSTAEGCGVGRDAIYQALRSNRDIWIRAQGDVILDAFEYGEKESVFGFKG